MAVVVIGASLPHWPTLPIWVPVMLAAAICWRLAARSLPLPLPNRFIRVLFAGIAFAAILAEYRTINGLNAGSALLVVMIALKYLESRNQRDQLVLMMISYFLVFAGLLYQTSALTGLYLLGFVWITTIGLMQLGRRGQLLGNVPTAKLAAKLLLQATPLMAVLFVVFPRLPGPLWAIPGDTDTAVTGLTDRMSPGDITELGLSDEIAFRVDFADRPPAAASLYWRGPVLSNFNGRTWTRREGMRGRPEPTLSFAGEPVRYRVMLEPQPQGWAFALEMPSQWNGPPRQTLVMQSDYQLRVFLGPRFESRFDYDVMSYPSFTAREPLDQVQRDYYLRLPEGFNPRTRALVGDMLRNTTDPQSAIARTLRYFEENPFFYTLTPAPLGRDSVDDFLFETREGFCEHYASAFAIMMRMAGIPARVVTGYQGGELNPLGDYFIVRQSNAHAWTEVWLEQDGWRRVDPISAVAPERIALGVTESSLRRDSGNAAALRLDLLRQVGLVWDAFSMYWENWVIGYSPLLQRTLFEFLGFDRPRWLELLSLTLIVTVVMVVALSLLLAWAARARERQDPAAVYFARFARRAARGTIEPRRATESPSAFGNRLRDCLPARAAEIDSIVQTYLRARYERDPGQARLTELRALVAAFPPTPRFAASPTTRAPGS